MSARNTVFGNASAEAISSDRILQIAFAAWRQGNFVEAVDRFSDQFTFTDHALGLEFKDKRRLGEFLAKINEWFPDSERKVNAVFSSEDRVISEWTLTPRRLNLSSANLFSAVACERSRFACEAYLSCR